MKVSEYYKFGDARNGGNMPTKEDANLHIVHPIPAWEEPLGCTSCSTFCDNTVVAEGTGESRFWSGSASTSTKICNSSWHVQPLRNLQLTYQWITKTAETRKQNLSILYIVKCCHWHPHNHDNHENQFIHFVLFHRFDFVQPTSTLLSPKSSEVTAASSGSWGSCMDTSQLAKQQNNTNSQRYYATKATINTMWICIHAHLL